MTTKEMIQTGPRLFPMQPTAPSTGSNLSSFERTVILSSDLQFIDMVKSVVVMQITSPDHLEQLILKLNEAKLPNLSESRKPVDGDEEDDQYIFLVRHQIDEQGKGMNIHIEIKSECLRNLLRTVLGDVCGISLDEGKLSIEQSVFQTRLEKHGICYSLMDLHPVDVTHPEQPKVPEPYLNLDTLEGFEG